MVGEFSVDNLTAISAPTLALFLTSARLASRLRPLVACMTRFSRKGVISLPMMLRLLHS